jgi:hypothetical protein
MDILTKEELEVPRSADQFLPWVENKIDYLRTIKEDKRIIRFRQGFAKELIEEAFPIGIFCLHHFKSSPDVKIQHIIGDQKYDAIVTDLRENKSPIIFLEVTQAHEGENEHLWMLALERDGYVSAIGSVRKTGTKHTGITVHVSNEAKSQSELINNELDKIKEAAKRKSGKVYPKGTALLIVFDDRIVEWSTEDSNAMDMIVKDNILQYLINFRWVALIGWSKRTYLEFNMANYLI